MKGLLHDDGFDVLTASNGYEALQKIDNESPDLVLLDIWMPGIDGLETLKAIKSNSPFIQVIIITGHGNVETAVKATKLGAFDLIEKPLSFDKVIVAIHNALNFRRLEEENRYLRKKTLEKHSIDGRSKPILALKQKLAAVAPKDSWILIYGENGTGKELVARTIYQLSARVDKPFVVVNCAAIPEELIESNLFGHEKGAFKGAASKKRGTFEIANEGTIFLDEISDMSLKTQAKILRVLQEQKFQRVGGGRELSVDVRVIAATNKSLRDEIDRGRFREDLYHRLNVVPIEVPSLRERAEDIPLLVELFLAQCERQNGEPRKTMAADTLDLLMRYPWPGNVRELKNLVEHLAILAPRETIKPDDIPRSYHSSSMADAIQADKYLAIDSFKSAKKAFEKAYIKNKLDENHGNITRTAMKIGVGRSYLHKKLKQLGL